MSGTLLNTSLDIASSNVACLIQVTIVGNSFDFSWETNEPDLLTQAATQSRSYWTTADALALASAACGFTIVAA